MDTILLRTMTLKSCFDEGKFKNVKIQTLFDLHETRYLRWAYYNLSNINFNQEVKNLIGITSEFEIKKPGTCKEMNEKLNSLMDSKISFKAKKHLERKKRIRKEKADRLTIDKTSKSVLQSINQGRF